MARHGGLLGMAVVLLGVMLAFQGIDGLQGVEGRSPGDLEKLLTPTQGERLPDDLDNIDGAQDVPADNRPGKVASPAGFGDPFAGISAPGGFLLARLLFPDALRSGDSKSDSTPKSRLIGVL